MVVSLLAGIYPVPTDTATCLTDPKTTRLTCVHTVLATMAAKATEAPPNKSMLFAFLHEQALAVPVEVVDGKNSILHANHVRAKAEAGCSASGSHRFELKREHCLFTLDAKRSTENCTEKWD